MRLGCLAGGPFLWMHAYMPNVVCCQSWFHHFVNRKRSPTSDYLICNGKSFYRYRSTEARKMQRASSNRISLMRDPNLLRIKPEMVVAGSQVTSDIVIRLWMTVQFVHLRVTVPCSYVRLTFGDNWSISTPALQLQLVRATVANCRANINFGTMKQYLKM